MADYIINGGVEVKDRTLENARESSIFYVIGRHIKNFFGTLKRGLKRLFVKPKKVEPKVEDLTFSEFIEDQDVEDVMMHINSTEIMFPGENNKLKDDKVIKIINRGRSQKGLIKIINRMVNAHGTMSVDEMTVYVEFLHRVLRGFFNEYKHLKSLQNMQYQANNYATTNFNVAA